MTEQGKVFREESLEVLGISKGKVEIKPSWTKFPMKVSRNRDSMQDEAEMMEMLAEGAMAGFVLVRENSIANNQYQDERGYYWGIWSIGDAMTGGDAAHLPQRDEAPADSPAGRLQAAAPEKIQPDSTNEPEDPMVYAPTGERMRGSQVRRVDPTRDSIERQTAAKDATQLVIAFYHDDSPMPPTVFWDEMFDHVIARIQGTPAPSDLTPDDPEQDATDRGMPGAQEGN